MLTFARIDTPIGTLTLVAREELLTAVVFPEAEPPPGRLGKLEPIASRFHRYFAGELDALWDLALDVGGTPLQKRVWAALRAMRPGETRSYQALAREVGAERAVRAVASANARNPVPIVVPCHRIVRADGSLGGYAGGLARKRWLLAHEGAQVAKARAAWLTMEPSPASTVCS